MRKPTILIVLLFSAIAFAASIFSEASAVPGTNRVTIKWITSSEINVDKFVVLRSNDDVSYIEITRIIPKGPGTHYEYVDDGVLFKDISPLFYKLRAVDINGKVVDESSMLVHPNISGIFRTWGTLKALFR